MTKYAVMDSEMHMVENIVVDFGMGKTVSEFKNGKRVKI